MTRRIWFVVGLLPALFHATHGVADPSSSSRYLMNEPVSMFTHGMDYLNIELEDTKKSVISTVGNEKNNNAKSDSFLLAASYDFDSDRISIGASCFDCGLFTADETTCAAIIKQIRSFGYVKDDGSMVSSNNFSPFTMAFHQFGYVPNGEPKDLDLDLAKKMQIHVFLSGNDRKISCDAQFLATGYSVQH